MQKGIIVMDNNKLNADIKHWQERAKGLEDWKSSHDYNDPNWDENSRDLNNAYLKILQLKDHLRRPVGHVADTYSVPNYKK